MKKIVTVLGIGVSLTLFLNALTGVWLNIVILQEKHAIPAIYLGSIDITIYVVIAISLIVCIVLSIAVFYIGFMFFPAYLIALLTKGNPWKIVIMGISRTILAKIGLEYSAVDDITQSIIDKFMKNE